MEARPSLRRAADDRGLLRCARNDKGCFATLAMTALRKDGKPLAEECEQIVFANGFEQNLVKAR